jgi:hypothetical protein
MSLRTQSNPRSGKQRYAKNGKSQCNQKVKKHFHNLMFGIALGSRFKYKITKRDGIFME